MEVASASLVAEEKEKYRLGKNDELNAPSTIVGGGYDWVFTWQVDQL